MSTSIHVGDRGRATGPLKPNGRISINDMSVDAASEGEFIDGGCEVVVIGGTTDRVVVRVFSDDTALLRNHGEPLSDGERWVETPLESPPAWVEQLNTVWIGFFTGIALVPCLWYAGTPMSMYALALPASGALSGWLFGVFVGVAIETVGPREDHRPRARAMAMIMVICVALTCVAILNTGAGFFGVGWGIPVGVLAGGVITYLAWLFSLVV